MGGLVLAAIVLGLLRLQPQEAPLQGRAVAIDGDTLRLASTHVRLVGLDAPELQQTCSRPDGTEWPCGAQARAALASRLRAGPVECAPYGRDVYGRSLGRCTLDGADLGSEIVAAGWAVNTGEYASEASAARTQELGIWSGAFDQPAAWRRTHRADQADPWQWIRSWFQ